MNPGLVFSIGIVGTMGVVFLALVYLRNPLQVVLTDLCGSVERARFWTAFSNITLFLVPLVLALNTKPVIGEYPSIMFAVSDQIEAAMAGLIISVVVLGIILSWFIARAPQLRQAPRQRDATEGAL